MLFSRQCYIRDLTCNQLFPPILTPQIVSYNILVASLDALTQDSWCPTEPSTQGRLNIPGVLALKGTYCQYISYLCICLNLILPSILSKLFNVLQTISKPNCASNSIHTCVWWWSILQYAPYVLVAVPLCCRSFRILHSCMALLSFIRMKKALVYQLLDLLYLLDLKNQQYHPRSHLLYPLASLLETYM